MDILSIDINADVGEGLGNEAYVMPYLSSCSIACGGHAGNISTMTEVVKLAKQHHVIIGAHPSFPDKTNFGRLIMDINLEDLYLSLKEQILSLKAIATIEGVEISHVKPHGALYNLVAKDKATATTVLEVVKDIDPALKVYAPYNSKIDELAKPQNLEIIYEGFADRNYNNDLSLVSRGLKNALLVEKEAVLAHVISMIKDGKVRTIDSVEVPIVASTFCVHGDTENAIEILRFLNEELPKHGIEIR